MLFQGIRLLFTNWRLTLVQILPAMWIWAAMLDLKAHALHGREFHIFHGPLLAVVLLVIAGLTAGSFYLNAGVRLRHLPPRASGDPPRIRPGPPASPHHPGVGSGRRSGPRVRHHGRRPVGQGLVLGHTGRRGGRDDGGVCGRAGTAGRGEVGPAPGGTSWPPRRWVGPSGPWCAPHRSPSAGWPSSCSARTPSSIWPSCCWPWPSSSRPGHQLGQGHQDERQAHRRRSGRRRTRDRRARAGRIVRRHGGRR